MSPIIYQLVRKCSCWFSNLVFKICIPVPVAYHMCLFLLVPERNFYNKRQFGVEAVNAANLASTASTESISAVVLNPVILDYYYKNCKNNINYESVIGVCHLWLVLIIKNITYVFTVTYGECKAYSIYFSAECLNLRTSIEGSMYFINSYSVWISVKCIAYLLASLFSHIILLYSHQYHFLPKTMIGVNTEVLWFGPGRLYAKI